MTSKVSNRLAERLAGRAGVRPAPAGAPSRSLLWQANPDTLVVHFVSTGTGDLLGGEPNRFVGNTRLFDRAVHLEDRERVAAALRQAASGGEVAFECRLAADAGRDVRVQCSVRRVTAADGVARLVGTFVEADARAHAEAHLAYIRELRELSVEISRRLVRSRESELDAVLGELLSRLGFRCGVDRAYVIRFDAGLATFSNTHEWTAPGIEPQKSNLQAVPVSAMPEMMRHLERHEKVCIPAVDTLPAGWARDREALAAQNIRSLLCLPVMQDGRLVGTVGFDAVGRRRDWQAEEIALLSIFGDLVGDAMARAEADGALRRSESRRAYAESLAGMGSWEWDIADDRFHASDEWRQLTGMTERELCRAQVLELTPPSHRRRVAAALSRVVESGAPYAVEHPMVRADNGEKRWLRVHAERIEDGDGAPRLRGFSQDITAQKDAETRLFRMAHFDALTGFPNRSLLMDRLQQATARRRRTGRGVALLFIDIDHFKKVNDTLGHQAGDRLLVEAARRIRSLIRDMDTVARIGGDEFVVLVQDAEDPEAAAAVAEKILQAFRQPFDVDRREIVLTASIGISTCRPREACSTSAGDGDWPEIMMRNADTAMYEVKGRGRDGYRFFNAGMNAELTRRVSVEQALRGALDRDELGVVYQPLVDVGSGAVAGVEALLRWHHPELGAVRPDEFIPLAEQSGAIDAIGEFVFRRSLAAVAKWRRDTGQPVTVSVNVSPRQFRDPELPRRIAEMLRAHDVPATALDLEVTEGVLLDDDERTVAMLETLRALGVGLVMDDFGTGYASLRYLRDHPFTALKIDRDFVRDVHCDARHRQLVTSALQLGRSLAMKVVAEGVETGDELGVLAEEGCALAQGYLFSPAVPAERIAEWLAMPQPFGHVPPPA
jgi:diguanylate cyclase (GGDEF)-like protein/PAS domain S-box-containing protein